MICSTVLILPPRLAAMTPCLITQNRSSVTPTSRTRMIDGHPPWQVAEHRQGDQRRAGQRLVGDRIGDLAEVGDHAAAPGELAVEQVGDRGDAEDEERHDPRPGAAGHQEGHEDRHEHKPQHGEPVREIDQPGRGRRGPRVRASQRSQAARDVPCSCSSIRSATRSTPSDPDTRTRTRSPTAQRPGAIAPRWRRPPRVPDAPPAAVPPAGPVLAVCSPGRRPAPRSAPRAISPIRSAAR